VENLYGGRMKMTPIRVGTAASLAFLSLAGLSSHSHAQLIAGPGMSGGGKPQAAKPVPKPPPALPGAQPDSDRVTPSEKSATDLPPTEALFDAINRGDITSARDAISRGADLNGHNLLGMSPMELSVDLGRNNISFLLLSLRGSDSSARPTKTATAPPPPSTKSSHRPQRAERKAAAPVREASAPAPKTPRLFAGDGGAPIPSAGFLGFDAGHAASSR
jgi:hypothetical protein